MKKLTSILIVLIVLTAIGIGVFMLERKAPQSQTQQPISFPSSSSTSSTATSGTQSNFLANPEIHADPNNPGEYFVGYQPSDVSAPYQISYIDKTHYFNVVITQEPIGENRKKAEKYLMQLLGATRDQMCSLQYSVYVPNEVNSQYSGENLGFSFCLGAVQLP